VLIFSQITFDWPFFFNGDLTQQSYSKIMINERLSNQSLTVRDHASESYVRIDHLPRREFLQASAAAVALLATGRSFARVATPTDDPLAGLKLARTGQFKWATVVDITTMPGDTADQKLAAAMAIVASKGVVVV
jgi:hypothetical protein